MNDELRDEVSMFLERLRDMFCHVQIRQEYATADDQERSGTPLNSLAVSRPMRVRVLIDM
jgi:hypothetical protein